MLAVVLAIAAGGCGDGDDASDSGQPIAGGQAQAGQGTKLSGEPLEIAQLVERFQDNLAKGEAPTYCAQLTASGRRQVERFGTAYGHGRTCEETIYRIAKLAEETGLVDEPRSVVDVRLEGDKAIAEFQVNTGQAPPPGGKPAIDTLVLVRQGDEWKVPNPGFSTTIVPKTSDPTDYKLPDGTPVPRDEAKPPKSQESSSDASVPVDDGPGTSNVGDREDRDRLLRVYRGMQRNFQAGDMAAVCRHVSRNFFSQFPLDEEGWTGPCKARLARYARLRERRGAKPTAFTLQRVRVYDNIDVGGITVARDLEDPKAKDIRIPFMREDGVWKLELGAFPYPEMLDGRLVLSL